jgi:biotin carboxyl carrier protein
VTRIKAEIGDREYDVALDPSDEGLKVLIDGREHIVDARGVDGFFYSLLIDGLSYEVTVEENAKGFRVQVGTESVEVFRSDPLGAPELGKGRGSAEARTISAFMPGKVVRVLVKPGDEVAEGQPLLVLEAMKMENEVLAPAAGTVTRVEVTPGSTVEGGAALLVLE